jgi:hypothetical protein
MAEQPERPRRRRAPTDAARPSGERGNGQRPRRLSAADAAHAAIAQIGDLTGHDVEGVISVERNDDGWRVGVEVVESHRIPDSADILAIYEVDLDADGELVSYRRTERYSRGQTIGRSR